jgi:DNA polymerase delta subunit 1
MLPIEDADVKKLRILRLFERAQIDYRDMFTQEVMTYESNIAYTMRFMIDTKVSEEPSLVISRA